MKTSQKSTAYRSLKLYWSYAWKYPGYVVALLIMLPLTILTFRFLPPIFVARILERISRQDFTPENVYASFGSDLAMYAALIFIAGIIMWRLNIFLIWKLEMRVLQDIHMHVFQHFLLQSADFHANRFGGSLVSQTNKFAGSYVRLADTVYFQIIGLVVSFIFTMIILGSRAPTVVAFLLLLSLTFMYLAVRVTKPVRKLNAVEAAASTQQTGKLADAITNIMALKSFAARDSEINRYHSATQKTRLATNNLMWASIKRDILFACFTTGVGVVALLLAVYSVVHGRADIATVFLVVTYTGIISQNLWDFSQQTLRNINRGLGDAQEITNILAIEPSIKDSVAATNPPLIRGDIRFENIVFRHDGEQSTLFDRLSLHIKPGEKVGLVGHSGSGKTTLTKLLLRFTDVQEGQIIIDNANIATDITQEHLRSRIAYVPQEPLLFHRSLKENIAYGRPGASQHEIEAIAKMAHAHDFIMSLPQQYDTLVGERGVKLSGGQRQRVAIARAMIKNAPILILDEATSALDSESEHLIQDALWRLMEGRTAIVVAHRLSTIQKMDRIFVMSNGKIVEEGSHNELVRKGGTYAELWSHQSGNFLDEQSVAVEQ